MALRRVLSKRGKRPSRRGADGERSGLPLTIRHPRAVLVVAAVAIVALGLIGLHVERKLSPTSLDVPGTPSSRATNMLQRYFGDSAPFAILLRGPGPAIDKQGPALIHALRQDHKVTTISPWDRGNVARLRPSPRKALILVDFHVDIKTAVRDTVPELNDLLERQIKPPVNATQTGFASLSRAIQDESIASSERGELLALPFLLIVLLLVFRSPIAASIPMIFGAITVITSRGVLSLLASTLSIDAFALTVSTMMGLALGVDYSLLMVSRFREELAEGAEPAVGAATTRRTAGRTTLFAGSTLFLSMFVSVWILPGALLVSLAGTVIIVVILSVFVATMVAPALLTLLGPNVDRWRIAAAAEGRSRLMTTVDAALRRPKLVAAVIGGIILVLAGPALGLKTGPPDTQQLPTDNEARQDAELVDGAIGAGWDAPFQIIAATRSGTITDQHRLAVINRFQNEIAQDHGVQAVIGPGQISKRVKPIQQSGNNLLADKPLPGIGKLSQVNALGKNLGRAADGVTELRIGLSRASYGAAQLGDGSGDAQDAAEQISAGLARASAGSTRAVKALNRFARGAEKLFKNQKRTVLGNQIMKDTLRDERSNLKPNVLRRTRRVDKSLRQELKEHIPQLQSATQTAGEQLQAAWQDLQEMGVGKSDPKYGELLEAVRQASLAVTGSDPATGQPDPNGSRGLATELAALQKRVKADTDQTLRAIFWLNHTTLPNVKKMHVLASRLLAGSVALTKGNKRLFKGAQRLANAAQSLEGGLSRLDNGATRLSGGLGQLVNGAGTLAEKLSEGFQQSAPIQSGLRRATVRVTSAGRSANENVDQLREQSPGLFNSGYFVLSALDGAPKQQRQRAGTVIDLKRGGQATSILVVPKYTFNTPGSVALDHRLQHVAARLAAATDTSAGVAGGAAQLTDYNHVTKERIPFVVLAITVATFLVLVIVLRALLLAALAVALNLATVGVAFGVLTLLFNVPEGYPLGGHTYVDAVGAVCIFGVVFGLSIDYAVFLLMRMRESYEGGADNATAIAFGLEKTARVITGAALIMMAVFIAFGTAKIATVSQLGVGLTIAVLLDATVIRIVLLPALMLLLGDRVWWLPRWLERILPKIDVEGTAAQKA